MKKSFSKNNQQKKKKTSTPMKKSSNLSVNQTLNVSDISVIRNSSSSINKDHRKKEGTVIQHELDVAHNIYMLALATNRLQSETISNITAEQENQKLALLTEVEKKRCHLANLKKRVEEVRNLTERSHLLRHHKEKLGPVKDQVVSSLQNVKMLTNALDRDLPVSGFGDEIDASDIKNALYETKKTLGKKYSVANENEVLYSEAAEEVTALMNMVTDVSEVQKRCDSTSHAVNAAVIKESSLKVLKSRSKNEDISCPEDSVARGSS